MFNPIKYWQIIRLVVMTTGILMIVAGGLMLSTNFCNEQESYQNQTTEATAQVNPKKGTYSFKFLGTPETLLILAGVVLLVLSLKTVRISQPVSATDLCGNAEYTTIRGFGGGGESITEVIAALNTPPSNKADIEQIQATLYQALHLDGNLREYVRDQLVKYIATPSDLRVWCDVKTGKRKDSDLSESEQRSKRIIDNYLAQRMEK